MERAKVFIYIDIFMHVKKGGYAGRTTPGFNGSDPLRFGDVQREMDLARKQKKSGQQTKAFFGSF